MNHSGKASLVAMILGAVLAGFALWWGWSSTRDTADPASNPTSSSPEVPRPRAADEDPDDRRRSPSTEKEDRFAPAQENTSRDETTDSSTPSAPSDVQRLVAGRVVDGQGRIVAGATVRVVRGPETIPHGERGSFASKAVTGEHGRFVVDLGPSSVPAALVVEHPDFATTRRPRVTASTGEVNELPDIVLTPGVTLAGRVVTREGSPVAGADLYLEPGVTGSGRFAFGASIFRSSPASGQTDEAGEFALEHLPAGSHRLRVVAGGFAPKTTADVTLEEGIVPQPLEIVLEPGLPLAGRVVDVDGRPIEGVRVRVSPAGEPGFHLSLMADEEEPPARRRNEATTVANGEFLIEHLAPGAYLLEATRSGFARSIQEDLEAGRSDLEVVLQRTGGIRGRVVDAVTGAPVKSFTVGPEARPTGFLFASPLAPASSLKKKRFETEDGVFVLENLSPGTHRFEVRAKGYGGHLVAGVDVLPGETGEELLVALEKGACIRGQVLAALDRTPVAGARVQASLSSGESNEGVMILSTVPDGMPHLGAGDDDLAITDENGSFELVDLREGLYSLRVSHADFSRQTVSGLEVGRQETVDGVDILLTRSGGIEGTVYDPRGEPVVGAAVAIQSTSGYFTRLTTDDTGSYRKTDLDPGTYFVRREEAAQAMIMVRAIRTSGDDGPGEGHFDPEGTRVEVRSGERVRVDLYERAKATLEGLVQEASAPVAGIEVRLQKAMGMALPLQALSDEEGRYRFDDLDPASYVVSILSDDGERDLFFRQMEVRDGRREELDIALPTGVVEGRVVDLASNDGVAGAQLRLRERREGGGVRVVIRAGGEEHVDRTEANGTFRIGRVKEGTYDLFVTRSGYTTEKVAEIEVPSGEVVSGVEARLRPGGGVSGLITSSSGTPLPFALIEILDGAGNPLPDQRYENTGMDGRYEIVGLAPGAYILRVFQPGNEGEEKRVEVTVAPGEPRDLPIRMGG